jgi:pyruvate dehydrogenase E2 component (dihydrolipoamide acetyltransferase)
MAKILEMPKLSPTMEEGVLTTWHKKEGDAVAIDDLLAEVETDKATMEFRSFDKGTLLKRLVEAGATVKLGQPVAILGAPGEDVTQISPAPAKDATAKEAPRSPTEPSPSMLGAMPPSMQPRVSTFLQSHAPPPLRTATAPSTPEVTPAPIAERAPKAASGSILDRTEREGDVPRGTGDGRVLASPFVRKQARELGVDLRGARGTGPGGRIVAADLGNLAAATTPATPATTAALTRIAPTAEAPIALTVAGRPPPEARPLSMMRKTIARRLTESKTTVPHFYLTIDVDVAALSAFREQLNAEVLADGEGAVKISINDLLIKACALALKKVPECNATYTPDAILLHQRVDVSVAVAVPDGLVTPVVRDADQLSISAIAAKVRDLAARAKQKKLRPEEMTDGTFSISNLGMFGIDEFSAVINPPEGAILAVGRVRDEPVVKGGAVVPGKKLAMTLSCDHRVVDGAVGAAFLAELRSLLERPIRILTG